jgi:D-tyrosyl-tRNA(Tyr) deacylase
MRIVAQKVLSARVFVSGNTVGQIERGILVFLGVSREDTNEDAEYLLDKLLWLRIFPDSEGKMNRNIQDVGGSILVVSQFTLYADCRKGRRPSFDRDAAPETARGLDEYFLQAARRRPVPVQAGEFQAMMEVHLVNDGPVTIWLDSAERRKS